MTNKCYAYSTLKVKDILHWRTSRPQEFPFPGISEVQIQPKSGLVWSGLTLTMTMTTMATMTTMTTMKTMTTVMAIMTF